jgi:ADP-heptose:LPS heptosyltransferase/predicted SAM-dependent methyltransferase
VTWSAETSRGFEQDKICAFVVPYTRGRGLDLGCGSRTAWPHFIGVDTGGRPNIHADIRDLSLFADESMDFVFSSHALEDIEDTRGALAEWWRVVKPGGHLCLYLPHKDLYPNVGQPGANPAHKHDFLPSDIEKIMAEIVRAQNGCCTMLEDEVRGDADEYSFFQVYRKDNAAQAARIRAGTGCDVPKITGPYFAREVWERNPASRKRCLVVRFGAIGDQILASSILPLLREQGYHITYMTTPQGQEVLKHDRHIDEWIIQDKDQVPNDQLGPYLETIKPRFDKVVNLCESIEGALLTLPGRPNHTYDDKARRLVFGSVNYLERTHDIAGVPHRFGPRFRPTDAEKQEAWRYVRETDRPIVYWAIAGSSVHKVYPFTQVVVAWLLRRTQAHIVLAAGPGEGEILQGGLLEMLAKEDDLDLSRVDPIAGKWDIRRSLTFVEYACVVVGPETGLLNAASHLHVPKIVMLSHSSDTNLTKHWKNTTPLLPDRLATPCYPCHQLHYTWEHCHFVKETGGALCASNITPERVFKAILPHISRLRIPESHVVPPEIAAEKSLTGTPVAAE